MGMLNVYKKSLMHDNRFITRCFVTAAVIYDGVWHIHSNHCGA
jgi:hypothetical protein